MLWFRTWVDACHWCVTWAASGRLHGEGRPLARRAAFVPTSTFCSMADKFTTPVGKLSRLPASTARSSAIKRDSLAAELERGECHCHPLHCPPPLTPSLPTNWSLPSNYARPTALHIEETTAHTDPGLTPRECLARAPAYGRPDCTHRTRDQVTREGDRHRAP